MKVILQAWKVLERLVDFWGCYEVGSSQNHKCGEQQVVTAALQVSGNSLSYSNSLNNGNSPACHCFALFHVAATEKYLIQIFLSVWKITMWHRNQPAVGELCLAQQWLMICFLQMFKIKIKFF